MSAPKHGPTRKPMRMREMVVVREISRLLLPFILLFAFYVQFHGDFGPGGGFQAGVIMAAGLILYGLVFGLEEMQRMLPTRLIQVLTGLGVLIYGGTGVAALFMGGQFLEYKAFDAHHGEHWGLFFIEGGVGITVTAAMVSIFYSFAGRELREDRL